MILPDEISVDPDITVREALAQLERSGHGLLLILTTEQQLAHTVTDGDLRRLLLRDADLDTPLTVLSHKPPVTIAEPFSTRECLELMRDHGIEHLPVIDLQGRVARVIEWQDIKAPILLSPPHLGDAERAFVEEAFASNWIAPLGPNVDAFESELATLVGVGHAAALSSGTAALHLALRILDVKPGDYVLCSSFTFVASVNPILYEGAIPVLIDSEPDSWNMSPQALSMALQQCHRQGRKPAAAIVVNLYGQSAAMDELVGLCREFDVPIIEDAAESLGAFYKGRASGTIGDLGIYSFNGNKIITTSGGGMLVSDCGEKIARARHLSTQAKADAPWYQHEEVGYNYRMSNILAGVGRGQLSVLADRVAARRGIFEWYRDELSGISEISWMPEPSWSRGTRWLTTAVLQSQAEEHSAAALIRYLNGELIEARHVWKPMHRQPLLHNSPYYPHGDESISDSLFENGICFPSGSSMTRQDVTYVADMVKRFFN